MKLADIILYITEKNIDVTLIGSSSYEVYQVSDLKNSTAKNVTFFNDSKLSKYLATTKAGVIITNEEITSTPIKNQIIVQNPYYIYALVAGLLNPTHKEKSGIHPNANVHDDSNIDTSSTIMAFVSIKPGAKIGKNCTISESCYIGTNVIIGDNCIIEPNVVIHKDCQLGNDVSIQANAIIGVDGFGWAPYNQSSWKKIPHIGKVVIGNRVSIGGGTTISRGTIQDTTIGDDAIIDAMVQISHNVNIGSSSAIAAQSGLAGSCSVGKKTIAAGQVGFAGHIHIADGCTFMAKSGITNTIKESGVYAGFPAVPHKKWQKNQILNRNLEKMNKQIKELKKDLKKIMDDKLITDD